MKKYFFIGSLVGITVVIFVLLGEFFFPAETKLLLWPFIKTLTWPVGIFIYVWEIGLRLFCPYSTTNICRGSFDGGPLEPLEWTGMILSVIIGYGLLGILISYVYKKIKK